MVGVPRSTGCSLCIKRRIKCDEDRPSCANCRKYGTQCPGYDKGLKFVVGKTHRSRRQQRSYLKQQKSTILDSPISVLSGSESPSPLTSPSAISLPSLLSPVEYTTSPGEQQISTFESHDSPLDQPFYLSIHSPAAYQAQCLSFLVDNFPGRSHPPDFEILPRWMSHIPSRVGRSKALDAAITCFTTQQIGTAQDDQQLLTYGRSTYVQALNRLQKAINNPSEAASSETLCAAMLLCIYELFAGTTAFHSWTKHAAGIARLMIYRGPESHDNDFDHSMILAFRGIIITECMFNGRPCFLAEDAWQRVARVNRHPTRSEQSHDVFEDFSYYMAKMPELLRDGRELREFSARTSKDSAPVIEQATRLINRSLDLYNDFREWGTRFMAIVPYPKEVLSSRNDPIFPVVFSFGSTPAATLYCAYWACLNMLQEILGACGYPPDNAMGEQELVNNICKSVEYNGTGTWGPFRMAFPLRIAWECAPPNVRRWIGNWHVRFSKTYAATSPQSLPDIHRPKLATLDGPPQDWRRDSITPCTIELYQ